MTPGVDPRAELRTLLDEVRSIQILARRLVSGVMAGGYHSAFRGAGVEFDEVREYVPGDDPRSVDWNVTARVGKPYIKKYVDERELTMLFVVDISASMSGGYGYWSARQMAARICACLAFAAERNNDNVGLVAAGGGVDSFVPPAKGTDQVLRIIRDSLLLEGSNGGSDLAAALEFVERVVRRRVVVFVVSDFLDDGWHRAMGACAQRHDVVAVRINSPELTADSRLGLIRAHDPETGSKVVIDWSAPSVRDAWNARIAAWQQQTEQALQRQKVDLMDVDIPRERDTNAIAHPILKFFALREQRALRR